ncbi:uncharacterized protein LOC144928568 isoform X2 [Branchiostoma floridae x Branchiostoma belcheri]
MEQRQQDLHHNPESRVFIIHAGEDKESFVRPLVTNIQQQGVTDIFFDDISIEPGETIRERIISTLSSERLELAVIVVSTSLLNKQYWPKLEFETCLKNNKCIFPIWVDANNDNFKAFSELVGKYSPTLKQLSARRVQRDNLTDELPNIAAEIVQRLKPKAIQALVHLVPSPARSDSASSNEDQGTCMTGVNDEQQVQDKLKSIKAKQLEHLKMLQEIDLDFLTKVSQEGLMPKERIAEMTESMIRDIHQSGLEIIKVKTDCAIIHLVPNSLATLCAFWRDYRSGRLSEDFSQYLITDEMRTVVGKDLSIQVIMLEEQYRQWKHYFDALGSAVTLQRITPTLQALGAAADVTEMFEEFQSLSIDPSSSTTPKTFWRMESEQTQEDDATDAYSGVLQVVDDYEDAPPLELGPLKISEDDLTPQQMEMLRQKAAETGGNITVKEIQEIAAAGKSEPPKVQIGVVGDAGAGKSTFINSFRGLSPGDVGAAEVSAYGYATTQAMSYDVPGNELVLVDFPGVLFKPQKEASSHTAQEVPFNINSYLGLYGEKMQECDFFLIFVTNRLSNNVVWIAKEVRKMGKRPLFVRSQADLDIVKVKQDNPKDYPEKIDHEIAERQIMDKFRQRTREALEELGYGKVDDSNIFIISGLKVNVARSLYDMDELRVAMLNCLSTFKQEVLIKNTQDFSASRLAQKADVMRKRVWAIAAANAAVSAVPLPGLGVAADIATLFAAYKYLRRAFNIDDASLEQLASLCNKSALTLMRFRNQNSTLWNALKNSKGPLALRNLAAVAASSVTIAGLAITSATLEIALPIIGTVIAAPASFALIVLLVREFIAEIEQCATKLFKFAFSKDLGPADIGIVGDGNAGEASFIKYFGSLVHEEEGDRSKPITKTRFHKTSDNVVLVELPPPHVKKKLFRRTFDGKAYMKSFADDMKTCSVLLVFIGESISEGLLTIARKAKEMELDVLFIRTCLDEDELTYVDSIRKEAHKDLKAHIDGIAVTDIFVVDVQYDSMVQDKWDVSFLRTAILHAIDKIDMTDRNLIQMQQDLTIALKEGKSSRPSDDILRTLNGCTGTIKPTLPDWKTAVISIQLGVIGEAEAGIRTFICSVLGLENLEKPVQASDPTRAAVYHNPNHRCNISVVHFPPASLSPGNTCLLSVKRNNSRMENSVITSTFWGHTWLNFCLHNIYDI